MPGHRGQGLGNALFTRAITYLRNRGEPKVFVHCITENAAMMHLARKHGMRVIPAGSETEARLVIDPPTAHTRYAEAMQDHHARVVHAVRRNLRLSRAMLGIFSPG